MIRKMEKSDLDRVSKIWLDTNIKAHDFIPAQYWEKNYDRWGDVLLGMDQAQMSQVMTKRSPEEVNLDGIIISDGIGAAAGAIKGGMVGAAGGTVVVPGVGTAGGVLVGAIGGGLSGAIGSSIAAGIGNWINSWFD